MSTVEPAPLSQVERVYRIIREAIISGDYAPGSPLKLQELSEAHDMSFIPVREALRRLEAERLVETIPNKGARVAELSMEDIVDAYRTRIVLEVDALRRAYPHIDAEVIAEARRMKDEMVRRFNKGQAASGFDMHRAIHFILYEKSGSPWLLHLIRILWHHTERYRRIATGLHPTYDHVGREHAKVLDALDRRDLEGAAEALRLDLEHTADLILATYRDRETSLIQAQS
jgi:DNA-binding GntR family transcriptional regulator